MGLSYNPLLRKTNKKVLYQIVEVPGVCKKGEEYFADDANLKFMTQIPQKANVDIVYVRTSLQYSKNWTETLFKLCDLGAEYIILSCCSTGDIPTYLTLQLWADQEIPYWFINRQELDNILFGKNYEICSDEISCYMKDIVGWDLYKKFPETHRIVTGKQ